MFTEIEALFTTANAAKDASTVIQIVVALVEQFAKDKFTGNMSSRDAALDSVIAYLQSKKSTPAA